MKPTFDPIKFEVIRNALVEATEEMTIALRRSAYSTNIKTRADFSCAFFDSELQPVAQSFTQPVHLGSLSQSVPRVIREYGPENLGPGDAILSNDPYLGGVHLNDITLISPVYYNDALFGYVANLAHHVDVGGGAPASIGAFRESLSGRGHHLCRENGRRTGRLSRTFFALCWHRFGPSTRPRGTFERRSLPTTLGCVG